MKDWGLTCRGEDGGDLTLSDVSIRRENLICQVMGGDSIFFPMFGDEDQADSTSLSDSDVLVPRESPDGCVEESVLTDIRDMLIHAQQHGCWKAGVGGVGQVSYSIAINRVGFVDFSNSSLRQTPSDRYVASVLGGLPVSAVLNCGIELWRNLEIDDDELMGEYRVGSFSGSYFFV